MKICSLKLYFTRRLHSWRCVDSISKKTVARHFKPDYSCYCRAGVKTWNAVAIPWSLTHYSHCFGSLNKPVRMRTSILVLSTSSLISSRKLKATACGRIALWIVKFPFNLKTRNLHTQGNIFDVRLILFRSASNNHIYFSNCLYLKFRKIYVMRILFQ